MARLMDRPAIVTLAVVLALQTAMASYAARTALDVVGQTQAGLVLVANARR